MRLSKNTLPLFHRRILICTSDPVGLRVNRVFMHLKTTSLYDNRIKKMQIWRCGAYHFTTIFINSTHWTTYPSNCGVRIGAPLIQVLENLSITKVFSFHKSKVNSLAKKLHFTHSLWKNTNNFSVDDKKMSGVYWSSMYVNDKSYQNQTVFIVFRKVSELKQFL